MTDKTKELSNLKRKVSMSTTQLSKSRKALAELKVDVGDTKPTDEQIEQGKVLQAKIARQIKNLDEAESAYKLAMEKNPDTVKEDSKKGFLPKEEPKKEVVKDEPKIEIKPETIVKEELPKKETKPETVVEEVESKIPPIEDEVMTDETWLRDYGNVMIQQGHSIRTVISRFLTALGSRLTPQECLREYKRFDDPVMCVKRAFKLHVKDFEQGH